MRTIKTFFAIVMFIVSLVCLILAITTFADKDTGNGAGIFCLIVTGITAWLGINTIKIAKIKYVPSGNNEDNLFIQYEDYKGQISERTIEVIRVYKKGKFYYVDAYCFMCGEGRTFRVDRIMTMKEVLNDKTIDDIESYLIQKYPKQK